MISAPAQLLRRIARGASLAALAGATFLLAGAANAKDRCNTKPAVCMRLKAQNVEKSGASHRNAG